MYSLLSKPSSSEANSFQALFPPDGTPHRDLASALNGLMPLCRTIPGMRLALDIREGQAVLVIDWTPRIDGNAPIGSYHYLVSGEDGVREVAESQVLHTENGKDNLPENMKMEALSECPTASTEKVKEDSVRMKGALKKAESPTPICATPKWTNDG